MAGENRVGEIVDFLCRLTGEKLTARQPMVLRSVHRAALAAWSRKQRLPIRFGVLSTGAAFRIEDLVFGAESPAAPPVVVESSSPMPAGAGSFIGIGIDIEEVSALPEADDYREHPFYQQNFSVAEIAYCIRQADARASFCGTWAAKEAAIKAGLAANPSARLGDIEIGRDTLGRPRIAGGQLSISHTSTTAVAVCVALAAQAPSPIPVPAQPPVPGQSGHVAQAQVPASRLGVGLAVAASLAIIVAGSAASIAVHFFWQ
ncbi:MAG: 4'-phosphopantetheinyl transferase superfamily protein [Rhodopila sp.]|jgi:phosphopantetheine--protein transferase-like protein